MKYFKLLFFASLFLFFAQAVTPRQVKINEEVQKRVDRYKLSKQKQCDQRVMDRAITIVDSTLLSQAKVNLSHAVERPLKPDKPEVSLAKDTSSVKPIIEN